MRDMTAEQFERIAVSIGEWVTANSQFNVGDSGKFFAIEIADILDDLHPARYNRYLFLVRTGLWESWEYIPMKGEIV